MSEPTNDNVLIEMKPQRKSIWATLGIFIATIAAILFICAFSYGYFHLTKINLDLAKTSEILKDKLTQNQTHIEELQQSITELKQADEKYLALSHQQEQMLNDWQAAQKGNLNKWHVAEAQYLVKLANDHIQFAHDITTALTLLQRANEGLENLSDPSVLDIRKSLTSDMAAIEALPKQDLTSIYLQLNALNNQIDLLTLPLNPLQANAPMQKTVNDANTPWWQAGLNRTMEALHKIVIVRNTSGNALPLVLPDEKIFVYQNLHAQLEGAMWGVLHQKPDIYQANLTRSIDWIKQYFDPNADTTKSMLKNLQAMQGIHLQTPSVDLTATMQLFNQYMAQIAKS